MVRFQFPLFKDQTQKETEKCFCDCNVTSNEPLMEIFIFCIYWNPPCWAGYDTKPIFKRGTTGLNSEFFFSYISCYTKIKDTVYPAIYL